MSVAQERTEEATPKRRAKARATGQSVRSTLLAPALSLAAGVMAASACLSAARAWPHSFARAIEYVSAGSRFNLSFAARATLSDFGLWLPALEACMLAAGVAIAAAAMKGALGFAPRALVPEFGRLSPAAALRRTFSADSCTAVCVSAAACFFMAGLLVPAASVAIGAIAKGSVSVDAALEAFRNAVLSLWLRAVLLLTALAAIEMLLARWRFRRSLRMSGQELREERAQTETRPEIKGRRKAVSARRARGLRISAIRASTAVVTNPSHVAVALLYDPPAVDVPVIAARGCELRAAILRALAHAFDVPVVEAPELARMLYVHEVDEPIPEECYAAVASIFAWIVRTRGALRPPLQDQS